MKSKLKSLDQKNHQTQLCQSGHSIFKETCRSCKSLRAEWYDYLNKATGFQDVEQLNYGLKDHQMSEDLLKTNGFRSKETYEDTLNYSLWATEMAHKGIFQSEKDKMIWEYHSEGFSRRQIAPIVGYENSWITRKLKQIETYLKSPLQTLSSASFAVA